MIEGQNGLNWDRWRSVLEAAERLGFSAVFRSDHFTNGSPPDLDSLELWASLTYCASHTTRIEFGSLVTPVTFRHPAVTARTAAAADDLSGGRLVLGIGAGWQEREHQAFGIPFPSTAVRFDMLRDYLEVVTSLLRSDEPASYDGKHFQLHDAVLLPRPKRPGGPPILIGGIGLKRTLPLVARYADEWNAIFVPPSRFQELSARLDELIDTEGRHPGDVKRSLMTGLVFAETDAGLQEKLIARGQSREELAERGLVVATSRDLEDRLHSYADAGVERIMLQWLDLDDLNCLEGLARAAGLA
ncbi:MAG TPA: TIGR03560 family F420-dependent LLM class oxidoreductase [Chloroflexota bacterium]|nr:TIGR03560 family F420-dependent LLM class oxidoreductase [Chloroflexota bacterium]